METNICNIIAKNTDVLAFSECMNLVTKYHKSKMPDSCFSDTIPKFNQELQNLFNKKNFAEIELEDMPKHLNHANKKDLSADIQKELKKVSKTYESLLKYFIQYNGRRIVTYQWYVYARVLLSFYVHLYNWIDVALVYDFLAFCRRKDIFLV